MTDLNCQAVVATVPADGSLYATGRTDHQYCLGGGVPAHPYINVQGPPKAFVLSFSRALNRELRSRGRRVNGLCPSLDPDGLLCPGHHRGSGESVVKKYVAMYEPEQLVQRAWRDARRGQGREPVRLFGPVPDGTDGFCPAW